MTPETPISVVRYGCTIYAWLSTTTYDYGCNTESYGPIRIATNVHPWLIRLPVRICVTWALHYMLWYVAVFLSSNELLSIELEGNIFWNSIMLGQYCLQILSTYEPVHEISNIGVWTTSKASDQPAHTHSLTRAFASRLSILWLLSYWLNIILRF